MTSLNEFIINYNKSDKEKSTIESFFNDKVYLNIPNVKKFKLEELEKAGLKGDLQLQTATIEDKKYLACFTTIENSLLKRPCAEISFVGVLSFVKKLKHLQGILIQSDINAWIVIPTDIINNLHFPG